MGAAKRAQRWLNYETLERKNARQVGSDFAGVAARYAGADMIWRRGIAFSTQTIAQIYTVHPARRGRGQK